MIQLLAIMGSRGIVIQVNHWDTDLYIVVTVGCNTKYSINDVFPPVQSHVFGRPSNTRRNPCRTALIAGPSLVYPLETR